MQSILPISRLAFLAVIAVAVALRALGQPLDHDEHQFVASAALIARDGLVPYRDFPYFHLPYQSYLFAIPFQWSDHLLATARLVCAAAAFGTVVIVWRRARLQFKELPDLASTGLAVLFSLALVTNPLFLYSAGRAWNHDVATLLSLLAALGAASVVGAKNPLARAALAGVAAGLAVGVRLTFATLVPALAVAVWILHDRKSAGFSIRATAAFAAGVAIALAPVLVFFALDPAAFLYGNLDYNLSLDPLYRADAGYDVAMTFAQKMSYLMGDVLDHPRAAALAFAYAVSGGCIAYDRNADTPKAVSITVALCLPALFVAALLPTPTWYQYYYALQVFLVVGLLANLAGAVSWRRAAAFAASIPLLLGALTGARYLWPIADLGPVQTWTAIRAHETGGKLVEIAAIEPGERVLTLGPIFVLEGGASIYPQLATGPFQWRTAYLVPEADRRRFGVLGPEDLANLTGESGLSSILTGVETDTAGGLEQPLLDFVRTRGWQTGDVDEQLRIWRPSLD